MTTTDDRPFLRMNGLGNEILLLDLRAAAADVDPAKLPALAHDPITRFDQLMTVEAPRTPEARAFVRIFNADGSQASACGNGSRCVAWLLLRDGGGSEVLFETAAGLLECRRIAPLIYSVDMGRSAFGWRDVPLAFPVEDTRAVDLGLVGELAALGPASVLSMGNPHAVFFVDDPDRVALDRIGPVLERHQAFPERANVSVARVVSRDRTLLRVWERGAGLTKACGTAACAAAVSAMRRGLCDRCCTVALPGGELSIEWRADDRVIMTGPCELELEGTLPVRKFAREGAA